MLMVAPAVAAVVCLAGRHWWPTDDFAVIDLRVRDVFTSQTPLTGLYSRPGWSHPGPLMFWGMAPLSWLSGGAPWATRIGGAVLQAIALVWLGVVTARRSVRLTVLAGLVTSFTYLASNQWLFREPWNLHIPLPYFVLFVFLTYLASVGETRQFVGMSIAATVMVSTHISYVLLVVAGFAYALAWTLADVRRTGEAPVRWIRTLVVSVVVWVITWSAPLLDALLHWPGNLGKIASYFVGGGHPSVGIGDAVRYIADEFRWIPPWLGGSHRLTVLIPVAVPASLIWLAVPGVMVAVAVIAVRASRSRTDARMVGLALVLLGVGVLAISRADEPRAYTFQWRSTVAAFLAVSVASCVVTLVVRRLPTRPDLRRSLLTLAAVGVVAWGGVAMTIAVVRRPSEFLAYRERQLRAVIGIVDRHPLPRGPVRVVPIGPGLPSLFDGVVNELDRRGVDVRVEPARGRIFGTDRVIAPSARVETWYVTESGAFVPELLQWRGARVLVATSVLRPAEERELAALQAKVRRALGPERPGHPVDLDSLLVISLLRGKPGVPEPDRRRMAELDARAHRALACRCAIVVVPDTTSAA